MFQFFKQNKSTSAEENTVEDDFIFIDLSKPRTKPLGEINPEFYKKQATLSQNNEPSNNLVGELCGKLFFGLKYEKDLDSLTVQLFGANDLPAKDMNGLCDPYVKMFLAPNKKKKFQTKVQMKNKNPVFNETFMFNVMYEDLRKRYLQFSVYDFDRFSKHDLIGQVIFKNLDEVADLRQEVEYTMDIILPPSEKEQLGELNLCLCYLPTAGRLTVTILKGHKLKAMDIGGKSDPYVKVYLLSHGKKVKKKKTRVRHKTLCPVYNEALVFQVPHETIKDVAFVIQVIDYDRISNNDLMGCLVIGPNVEGQAHAHWIEMMEKPRKNITRWYPLSETLPDDINILKEGSFMNKLNCFGSN
ncbi:synaptotagmin-10-like isoform X1 [Diabrotica undecimpunctata]|uniref:synaptotagmin-10-like isoform X1 n=1 Tax=Diabrotica undecimpunctata TaxID=50387 RepID=UPI003B63C7BE